jgi:hypothetical protein
MGILKGKDPIPEAYSTAAHIVTYRKQKAID